MASTLTVSDSKINWGGGNEPFKASYGKLMMWFFLLSDAFTFSSLLISYALIRFSHPAFEGATEFTFSHDYWPVPEKVFEAFPGMHALGIESAPLVFVGLMTFILILSSVTMVLAVEAGHRGSKAEVEKWMLWTILGGATFLGCQAWEWTHFIVGTEHGLTLSEIVNGELITRTIYGANLVENDMVLSHLLTYSSSLQGFMVSTFLVEWSSIMLFSIM